MIGSVRWVPQAGVLLVTGLLLTACGADGPVTERGPRQPGTAGLVQDFLEQEVLDQAEGYTDAGQRLLTAALTGSADGVTLNDLGGSQTGVVQADLDGDGTRETPLAVTVRRSSDAPMGPVDLGVTIGGPGEDLLSLNARVTMGEGGVLQVDNAFGSVESRPVNIFADGGIGTVPMIPQTGTVLGTMPFDAFDPDYEDIIAGLFTIESAIDGLGRYRIRVTVEDDPDTPEDESLDFYVD
jgi:hypothetical protein